MIDKYCKTELLRLKTEDLRLKSEEVMADIRSAAWLEQELHPELDRHRRHQMADICEADNVERVWRVLGIAEAEVRLTLQSILKPREDLWPANDLERPDFRTFDFLYELPASTRGFIKEKIHEYFVASVMADRAEVIVPGCAPIWKERAAMARSELQSLAAAARPPRKPVRRPIWPM